MSIGDFLFGYGSGFVSFILLVTFRALRSGHWDTSNIFNVLRVIAFIAVHPEVFPYLRNTNVPDDAPFKEKYPFWYLKYDEFKEIVNTIPARKE